MKNAADASGNSLVVLQIVKHRVSVWPSNFTPSNFTLRYVFKKNENTHPHKNLYTNFIAALLITAKKLTNVW